MDDQYVASPSSRKLLTVALCQHPRPPSRATILPRNNNSRQCSHIHTFFQKSCYSKEAFNHHARHIQGVAAHSWGNTTTSNNNMRVWDLTFCHPVQRGPTRISRTAGSSDAFYHDDQWVWTESWTCLKQLLICKSETQVNSVWVILKQQLSKRVIKQIFTRALPHQRP